MADIDNLDENSDYVVLMTLHSAKGLEFPRVYLAGMEDGLFPSYMTVTADDPDELEEERRLCYVGITRAQSELTMTCARRRMVRGETQYNKMSRFLKEVPLELISTGNKFPEMEKVSQTTRIMKKRKEKRTTRWRDRHLRRKHLQQYSRENPLESLQGKAGVWSR